MQWLGRSVMTTRQGSKKLGEPVVAHAGLQKRDWRVA